MDWGRGSQVDYNVAILLFLEIICHWADFLWNSLRTNH